MIRMKSPHYENLYFKENHYIQSNRYLKGDVERTLLHLSWIKAFSTVILNFEGNIEKNGLFDPELCIILLF